MVLGPSPLRSPSYLPLLKPCNQKANRTIGSMLSCAVGIGKHILVEGLCRAGGGTAVSSPSLSLSRLFLFQSDAQLTSRLKLGVLQSNHSQGSPCCCSLCCAHSLRILRLPLAQGGWVEVHVFSFEKCHKGGHKSPPLVKERFARPPLP